MNLPGRIACASFLVALVSSLAAQDPADQAPLNTSGQLDQNGSSVPYLIRRLPPSSFPDLPAAIARQLAERGCLIPQTYEAHRPENVIRASLEHPGSADWAVLCSVQGSVSLLVFLASAPEEPATLATFAETDRLQPHVGSRTLGFNWGIDPASPRRVHDAQLGLSPRPRPIDHDALADSVIDYRTTYRYFTGSRWITLDTPAD